MNDSIQVLSNQIQIKEWAGQRVVTFEDIDTVHQRARGTASRNFRENRDKFIEGTDYFIINQPDEIRRLGIVRPQGGTADTMKKVLEACIDQVLEFDSPDEAVAFVDDLRQRQQRFNVSSRKEVNGKMRIRIQRAYNGNRLLTN